MDFDTPKESSTDHIKVYKYRWVVLFLLCMNNVIGYLQFAQFTIITHIITKYYGVDKFAVSATGLIFFIAYAVLFLPGSYLIEKCNLKVTLIISAGLISFGALVKLACAQPDRFYVVMIGQTFCAVGQIFSISISSKFSSAWFGVNEVSTACACVVLGTHLGAGLGCVLSPYLIKGDADSDIGENIYQMMMYNVIICWLTLGLVIIFFKARPERPPSESQKQLLEATENSPTFFDNCKTLTKNRNFLLLLLSFGLFNGIFHSFGITINPIYTHFFPDNGNELGIVCLVTVISGGCIGSLICGFILDRTCQFKTVAIGVMITSLVFLSLFCYSLFTKCRIGVNIVLPLYGFFGNTGISMSFEFIAEETYPIPASVTNSAMTVAFLVTAAILSFVVEELFSPVGHLSMIILLVILYLISLVALCFVRMTLRRRNVNMASQIPDVCASG